LAEYFAPTAAPLEKRLILQKIVESVHEQHGRFMKQDRAAGVWVPISKEEAALKTAMALQYRARKQSSPTALQTCANVSPPPHTMKVVATPPLHHSQSSPSRPFDIYAPPHVPSLRAMHVSPPVLVPQEPIVLVPQPIRISSNADHLGCLPGSFTLERYRYLQELYHQANLHCLAQRHAASIRAQLVSSAGFESCLPTRQAAVYSSEAKCNDSDWVRRVESTVPSFHEDAAWHRTSIASSPRSISESFWEPLPLLRDNHGATEQGLVPDPNDLLSEWSDSAFHASFDDVDEPLDLLQLSDLDW
jgi:hypothetical protein